MLFPGPALIGVRVVFLALDGYNDLSQPSQQLSLASCLVCEAFCVQHEVCVFLCVCMNPVSFGFPACSDGI